jgi:hypothetical protein
MCLPGSPCFGQTNNKRCGVDPCFQFKTGTDLVFYNGANLPNTGVDTCDSVSVVFQKIDEKLTPSTMTETIINTLSTNTVLRNQLKQILGI